MLCRDCFYKWFQSFHIGKYGEVEVIVWRCNIKPGRPVVLELVKDRGRTVKRKSLDVSVCSDYSKVEWKLEPFKLVEM